MSRGLALALVALGVLGLAYLSAVEAAVALAPERALETGLALRDLEVARAPASTLPDLRGAPAAPALLVLVNPPSLSEGERDALRAYVEEGGALWILSPHPSRQALWDGFPLAADAYTGFLFSSDGSPARLAFDGGDLVQARGFMALDLSEGWSPVLTADGNAFRDTNGNGRLDRGEPGGPFVAAAQAAVGEAGGRVVVMGVEDSDFVPPALAAGLGRGLRDGSVLVVDAGLAPAWAAPGLVVLALLGLPAGSLLAAGLLLLASAGLVALLVVQPDAGEDDLSAAQRLASAYAARLRERGRPEDSLILQSLQGDSPP